MAFYQWRTLNLANWQERVAIHLEDGGYDLSSHRAGAGRLDPIVAAEVGNIYGLRILHLQCHIGHDSIALAHRGAAEVVGIDFSPAAVQAASVLAVECNAPKVKFVESDIYGAPEALSDQAGSFDLVFTTWGTICWLPDLTRWARVIRYFLKPTGSLYFADGHPVALVFDVAGGTADEQGRPGWLVPYFDRKPLVFEDGVDYANPNARLADARTVQWKHPLADIIAALRQADLHIDWLHEHSQVTWRMYPGLVRKENGLWGWPDRPWLPLAVSLAASAT